MLPGCTLLSFSYTVSLSQKGGHRTDGHSNDGRIISYSIRDNKSRCGDHPGVIGCGFSTLFSMLFEHGFLFVELVEETAPHRL